MKSNKIKVVMLEAGKMAYVTEIGDSLHEMQAIVEGRIEVCYPFDEEVCIVCNDEGKINGLPLNRAIYDCEGNVIDIIAGRAFICDCSGDNLGSLSKEYLEKFCRQFLYPEVFSYADGKIKAQKFI